MLHSSITPGPGLLGESETWNAILKWILSIVLRFFSGRDRKHFTAERHETKWIMLDFAIESTATTTAWFQKKHLPVS